jgi:hypothetical protein
MWTISIEYMTGQKYIKPCSVIHINSYDGFLVKNK